MAYQNNMRRQPGSFQPAYTTYRPAAPVKARRQIRWGLIASVFLLFIFAGAVRVVWSKQAAAHQLEVQAIAAAHQQKLATLQSQLSQLVVNNPQLTMSISVADVTNGSVQHAGTGSTFDAASQGKLITAADYLHHVETGTASLSQNIDGQTAAALLKAMIVNSDDPSWEELNAYLGKNDLAVYASSLGITDYNAKDNLLSSNDIVLLLKKLDTHQLLTLTDTDLLLGYMRQANARDYIIPAINGGDSVYHKVGLDADNVHDSAIIKRGSNAVVLSIFTNGNGVYDWADRARLMQTITHDVEAAYDL